MSESSFANSTEPILPTVARARASQTSFPQVRSDLIALSTLSNSYWSDLSLSIMPVAIYPVHFSLNFAALMRLSDSS